MAAPAFSIELEAAAIRDAFSACNLEVADDALQTCIAICGEFGLTADELAARWDAHSMNHQVDGPADVEKLSVFRSKLAQEKSKAKESSSGGSSQASMAAKRKHGKISGTPVIKREIKTEDPLNALYSMKSPEGKHARSFASPPGNKVQRTASLFSPTSLQSPPGNSYENRTDAGRTVTEFNAHLRKELVALSEVASHDAVEVLTPSADRNMKPNASFMYTPLFERALALDEQISEYEELVKTHHKIEKLAAVGDPSPAQVIVVGRIVCEAAEGKLNPSVVQLEGSRKSCGGQRILLDLSQVPNFQVFPGKIVALEGVLADVRNPMAVKRFLEPIPAPMPTTAKAKLESFQVHNGSARPVRVVTACGPFTTTSNIGYLPLNDLLQVVKEQSPDVLVLVGPFIDSAHNSFQEGLVEFEGMMLSFEDIFVFNVMTKLDTVLESNKQLQIVLVPSLRDAHHQFVFPQPPFNKKKACEALSSPDHATRVHMMPNPCSFSINGIVFGVSAVDIVMHLSSNELHRQAVDGNKQAIERIKQSFMLETHVYRERILEATDATARARERINDVQSETLRLRKKCFKLQKLLQEKEATILSLQEQQDSKLSLLMHDTMQGVHRAMSSNQMDDDVSPSVPFGDSRLQLLRDQEEADAKLFEYEQQITKLYEELAEEKQRNEMLTECLQEQKQAKAKLLKACKVARKEIEAMKESGLHQMLDDLQQRCDALEKSKAELEAALLQEKTKVRAVTYDHVDMAID
ncbi:hypothetical protein ATCC90586_001698 [Pythium insidiosum]|nr:hypothetical protein ATCC90586_001698 [Pythium insidiosum]